MNDDYLRRALLSVLRLEYADGRTDLASFANESIVDALFDRIGTSPRAYAERINQARRSSSSRPANGRIPRPTGDLSDDYLEQLERLQDWFEAADSKRALAIRTAGVALALGELRNAMTALTLAEG